MIHLLAVQFASASTSSDRVDALFWFILCVSACFSLLIFAAIVFCTIRYRRRSRHEVGKDIGEHMWIEWTWSFIPLGISLVMFAWGAWLYVDMSRAPNDAMIVQVLGKQWMWKIQQPGGRKEINELHVPKGVPIKLVMTSQDVIHSFFLPAFRIKQDVVPGRYSSEWFVATKTGEFPLYCSEYCGTGHATMLGKVVVMEPAEYQTWAATGVADAQRPEAIGEKLFTQYGCIGCHASHAPSLAGVFGRDEKMTDGQIIHVDDDYLRESILNSRAKLVAGYAPIMPGYDGQLSEEQVLDLIAYIHSLSNTPHAGETEGAPR